LFAATHVHRLLQALLGLPTPVYRHHRLLQRTQPGPRADDQARQGQHGNPQRREPHRHRMTLRLGVEVRHEPAPYGGILPPCDEIRIHSLGSGYPLA